MNRVILKKLITYVLLVSLMVPFLTGVLLIEPAMAFDGDGWNYKKVLKGLLMMFLLSFVSKQNSEAEPPNIELPDSDAQAKKQGENYIRYQPQPGELETLAKAVYSEARGESYTGQVAVAAVILNRVDSSLFPDTIDGVVYQKVDGSYAFSAVLDGQIHLTPDQEAYDAARDALNGWDPSEGALYYYNPQTATADWIFNNTEKIKRIGEHVFARRKY